jgi:hypothetical protein
MSVLGHSSTTLPSSMRNKAALAIQNPNLVKS